MTIAGILSELTAFVLSILVEVNVAQIHLRIGRSSIENNGITAVDRIDIAWRLRAKAFALGVLRQHVSLLGDYPIGHLTVSTGMNVFRSYVNWHYYRYC